MGTLACIAPNCSMMLILLPLLFGGPFLFASFFLLLISPSFLFSFPSCLSHSLTCLIIKTLLLQTSDSSTIPAVYQTKRIYPPWNNLLEVKGSITSGMAWSGHSGSLKFSLWALCCWLCPRVGATERLLLA